MGFYTRRVGRASKSLRRAAHEALRRQTDVFNAEICHFPRASRGITRAVNVFVILFVVPWPVCMSIFHFRICFQLEDKYLVLLSAMVRAYLCPPSTVNMAFQLKSGTYYISSKSENSFIGQIPANNAAASPTERVIVLPQGVKGPKASCIKISLLKMRQ